MSTKAERSRNLRWKKPAISELSYWEINEKLDYIANDCYEIHWYSDDDDALINALDGNEEEAFEFKMLIAALEGEAYELDEQFRDFARYDDDAEKRFNDCSVALIGDRFRQIGYDDIEEDYYALSSYNSELAHTDAGKRVMRLTKAEMLSTIGQVLGMILAFKNIELKYEYLKATIDILRDQNNSVIQQIKAIETAYEAANEEYFFGEKTREFDILIRELPDKIWIE